MAAPSHGRQDIGDKYSKSLQSLNNFVLTNTLRDDGIDGMITTDNSEATDTAQRKERRRKSHGSPEISPAWR